MKCDPRLQGLAVYQVGGSVRDRLLGLEPGDRDFVVVGIEPAELIRRGFRPVGRDFPVFLHPESGDEYALARTERKQGRGYRGFAFQTGPGVTLEEDLARRDLTINAMALGADGQLIDPFNGRLDLQAGCLRHVTDAFREDPVRILRLARFATRFSGFEIAEKTLVLCRAMVQSGEVLHLVPERVWQEMSRAMMHEQPSRFFDVLRDVGALAVVVPEIDAVLTQQAQGRRRLRALDRAAGLDAGLHVRFGVLMYAAGSASGLIDRIAQRLRVPTACREMALLIDQLLGDVREVGRLAAAGILEVLQRLDVFRKPDRLTDMLMACQAEDEAGSGGVGDGCPQAVVWQDAAAAAGSVDGGALYRSGLRGREVAAALQRERIRKIAELPGR